MHSEKAYAGTVFAAVCAAPAEAPFKFHTFLGHRLLYTSAAQNDPLTELASESRSCRRQNVVTRFPAAMLSPLSVNDSM
jgi:hypothetical protein